MQFEICQSRSIEIVRIDPQNLQYEEIIGVKFQEE